MGFVWRGYRKREEYMVDPTPTGHDHQPWQREYFCYSQIGGKYFDPSSPWYYDPPKKIVLNNSEP